MKSSVAGEFCYRVTSKTFRQNDDVIYEYFSPSDSIALQNPTNDARAGKIIGTRYGEKKDIICTSGCKNSNHEFYNLIVQKMGKMSADQIFITFYNDSNFIPNNCQGKVTLFFARQICKKFATGIYLQATLLSSHVLLSKLDKHSRWVLL